MGTHIWISNISKCQPPNAFWSTPWNPSAGFDCTKLTLVFEKNDVNYQWSRYYLKNQCYAFKNFHQVLLQNNGCMNRTATLYEDQIWTSHRNWKMCSIFVVPCIMLYNCEISPTRCNNCVLFFAMALLYMFRATISPIIRSTMLYMATGKLAHLGCKFVSSKVVLSFWSCR